MSTKGASYRYGNTNGSNHKGEPSKHIGFEWAKDFNRGSLERHFNSHGKEFNARTAGEYAAMAVHFANTIDRKHYKSVVDRNGSTYKYDPRDGRLAIISKDGYIISYHHTGNGFTYRSKKGKQVKVWIKN